MKYYTIYKITNLINGKFYIGQHITSNLEDDYMGSGLYIKNAIKKYGKENFKREFLFVFDNESDMDKKEKELVTVEFCLRTDTYNICEGGFGGGFRYINRNNLSTGKLFSNSEEAKKKKSNTVKNLWNTGYYNDNSLKISEKMKLTWMKNGHNWSGKHHSSETKIKMSHSQQGKQLGSKNSQYGTMWITNGLDNKKIKKNDLDKWLSKGYTKGRKIVL